MFDSAPALLLLLGFGALALLGIYLRLPSVVGRRGEARVDRQLKRLDPEGYTLLSDLLLEANGMTSQIDHLVVSRYGIFVVETKNYSGWIHGSDRSRFWTQTIYRFKSRFPNPVKQNWSHIYALKHLLADFPGLIFQPIVVFVGGAVLKNVHTSVPVLYLHDLVPAIRQTNEITLSDETVLSVVQRLRAIRITDKQARKGHVRQVRHRQFDAETLEENLTCPRCGGTMVERTGKYGRFYGCSNYPRCRHTVPLR